MNIQEEWELHKPKKKTWGRFLRVIFGRTTFVITALLIYIINKNQNPSYQLSWIIPVLVFPVFGALFYLFVETQPGTRAIDRRLKEIIKETESMLRQRPEVMERLYRESRGTARLAYYMNRYGGYPIWENTSAQYFPLGDDMYPVLLEELKKAERYIFMEYFIVEKGEMWDSREGGRRCGSAFYVRWYVLSYPDALRISKAAGKIRNPLQDVFSGASGPFFLSE